MASADWKTYWLDRTLPELGDAALIVVYTIAGLSITLGAQALLRLRRCRNDISADPSKRASTFAACDAELVTISKRQFSLGLIFSVLAGALWATDAFISAFEVYNDVVNEGNHYSAEFWIALLFNLAWMMAILLFTQVVVPIVQMVAFCMWMQVRRAKISAATKNSSLEALLPEARTLATYVMLFWSAGFFAVVAFWTPMTTKYFFRGIILQATFGSVNAWSHMSFVLNWRADELQGMAMENLCAKAVTTKCITGAKALYTEKADATLLPQHEQKS